MKKFFVIISLILIIESLFLNTTYAEEFEILTVEQPVLCCDSELVVGERVEELPYSPSFDNVISPRISLFSINQNHLEAAYNYVYNILKAHPADKINSSNGIVFPLKKLGYLITQEEFNILLSRIMYENGDLFVSKRYTYSITSDEKYVDSVCFYYFVVPSKIDALLDEINSNVKAFIDTVNTDELSDFEKVLLTHDYISSIARYRNKTDSGTTDQFHSMYGLFVKKICVCQGYTEAMIFMLKKLGIDSCAVICDRINHVWNCVKIDGKWYHLDLTWDDVYANYVDSAGNVVLNIDSVKYDSFLQGFDDVIADKEKNGKVELGKTENGETIYGKYVYRDGDFLYPSFGIDNDDTENYEFREGYLFDGFEAVPMALQNYDGTVTYEKLEPKGFIYSNGKFVQRIVSNQIAFPQISYFESDSLKKMDVSVSRPFMNNYGEIRFLSYLHTTGSTNQFGLNMLVKNTYDSDFKIEKVFANHEKTVGNYRITTINEYEYIRNINNADSSEFFVWGNNLKPLSYKIRR